MYGKSIKNVAINSVDAVEQRFPTFLVLGTLHS